MKKTPKLRFPEFKESLIKCCFSKLFTEVNEKTSDTEKFPLYSLTIEDGVIPKSARYERDFLVKKKEENYKIVKHNQYVYNPMNVRFGAVARYKEEKDISVSGYYNIFEAHNENTLGYIDNLLKTKKMLHLYNVIATGSLEEKKRVHFSQFLNIEIYMPTEKEQEKISSFLKLVDEKIILQQNKIKEIEKYRKGILEGIFSKQLRFLDSNGNEYAEWGESSLGKHAEKITKKNKGHIIDNVISNSAKNGLISQREFFDKDIANQDNIDTYYVIEEGDFVYNPRKSLESPYGPVNRYLLKEVGVVSPLYLCFKINDKVLGEFLEYYFKSSRWHKFIYQNSDQGARHDRVSIKDSVFFELKIGIPCVEEQKKIVRFLRCLDDKLEKEKTKVELLIEWKKGLLKKML